MATITDTYFPGVMVVERPFQPGTNSVAEVTAFGAFIGKSDQGPTYPVECRSWVQFVTIFGNHYTDLHNAVYDFYSNGGRRAYIVRIAGVGGAVASLPVYDVAVPETPGAATPIFTVTASNPGTWGNQLRLGTYPRDAASYRFDVALYRVPDSVTFDETKRNNEYLVDQWNDVSLFPNDERYLYTVTNPPSSTGSQLVVFSGTSYDPALPNNPTNRPMPGTGGPYPAFTGGVDGLYSGAYDQAAAYGAAVTSMQSVPGPYVLNMPNVSEGAIIKAAIQDASARGDVFVVCDCPLAQTPTQIAAYVNTTLGLNTFNSKIPSFAAIYYPQVYMPAIGATVPGRTALRPAGGAIVGQYMATDDARGPWRVPAGRDYRVGGALQTERPLTEADLTLLNTNNVNALRLMMGTGVSIMGGRTLKRSAADMYINVRRTIMEITRSLVAATEVSLFENNDERLWEQLTGACTAYLKNIYTQGGLKGGNASDAFYVRCNSTNNTPNTIAQGVVNIEVGVALLTPAEFIVITIGQFESGATAQLGVSI